MRQSMGWGAGLLVACALLPARAGAQPVYRCETAGVVVFQDTSCADADAIDPLALEPMPPGPVPAAVAALVARYETRRATNAPAPAARSAPARRPARAPDRPAYRCIAPDGRSTYGHQPCRTPPAKKGERPVRIEQQLVTQREACEGRHAELDPYEREKRGPPDCR